MARNMATKFIIRIGDCIIRPWPVNRRKLAVADKAVGPVDAVVGVIRRSDAVGAGSQALAASSKTTRENVNGGAVEKGRRPPCVNV